MSKTKTPEEILKEITKEHEWYYDEKGAFTLLVIEAMKSYAAQFGEAEGMREAWEAGAKSVYECVRPEGPCDFDNAQHELNRIEYFKPVAASPKEGEGE